MHVLENGSLVISEVTLEDQGHYLCEASNGVGPALSVVAYLDVNVPPYFSEEFETKTVRSKDDVTISCEVFGETPLTVSWSKDRKPFGDLALPRFVLQEDTTAEGIVSKVFIPSVGRDDSGVFSCEATNSYGKKDRTIQLIVQGAPETPRDIHVEQVTSRSVTLYWTQPHTGNSPILGYTILYVPEAGKRQFDICIMLSVKYKPHMQQDWILLSNNIQMAQSPVTLPDLVPGTWYDIMVSAYNDAGATEVEYRIATLTLSGATVAPLAAQSQESSGSLLRDPAVLVPVACAVVVVLVICLVVGVVLVLRRRENAYDTCHTQHICKSAKHSVVATVSRFPGTSYA
ncbi:hypothetical protein HPB48_005625 [Haemaphysalis longicornis]|uniref:Cell adhesion molecule n=1 Tax=Haemaphysalis longicornis TaxID=44386 RepID=A0A9J6GHL3_HAELO|nr:hypothetical protein HPB48_005625 [Haemaphysalis longicornis]